MVNIWDEDDLRVVLSEQTHLRNYREFVLKFMLTYGFEPAYFSDTSPLWGEYTNRVRFYHVLDEAGSGYPKRQLSKRKFDLIMEVSEKCTH